MGQAFLPEAGPHDASGDTAARRVRWDVKRVQEFIHGT